MDREPEETELRIPSFFVQNTTFQSDYICFCCGSGRGRDQILIILELFCLTYLGEHSQPAGLSKTSTSQVDNNASDLHVRNSIEKPVFKYRN